jgi:hypothetical protein
MQKVNDVANMWGCTMPSEHSGSAPSTCPVNASLDGTLANPGTDPEFCDKIIANDAVAKLRLLAANHAKTAQPFFMACGFRKPCATSAHYIGFALIWSSLTLYNHASSVHEQSLPIPTAIAMDILGMPVTCVLVWLHMQAPCISIPRSVAGKVSRPRINSSCEASDNGSVCASDSSPRCCATIGSIHTGHTSHCATVAALLHGNDCVDGLAAWACAGRAGGSSAPQRYPCCASCRSRVLAARPLPYCDSEQNGSHGIGFCVVCTVDGL